MIRYLLFVVIALSLGVSSCTINKEFMFKTEDEYVFDVPVIDSSSIDYKIQPNDVISFDLYTNEGAMMLEFTTSAVETPRYSVNTTFRFTVDSQGYVEFPVIGRKQISGMTIRAAQDFLEDAYTGQFNGPYVIVKVLNRRAIVFTAPAGTGKIISLENQGVNVIEAIALAGGVGPNGNAEDIKIIRRVGKKQEVYHIDLSTIDGIRYANMSVEAGDIIYVQPTKQTGREITNDISPYLSVISTLSLAVALITRLF